MSDTPQNIAELQAQLEALQTENAALKVKKTPEMTMKVSQKGAVSVYGLQRFPVTLYANQFERLLDKADDIRQFIVDNAGALAQK